jgi:hypothetical protein
MESSVTQVDSRGSAIYREWEHEVTDPTTTARPGRGGEITRRDDEARRCAPPALRRGLDPEVRRRDPVFGALAADSRLVQAYRPFADDGTASWTDAEWPKVGRDLDPQTSGPTQRFAKPAGARVHLAECSRTCECYQRREAEPGRNASAHQRRQPTGRRHTIVTVPVHSRLDSRVTTNSMEHSLSSDGTFPFHR